MKRKPHPKAGDGIAKRVRLMESILTQVPFEGWTDAAFTQGIKQAGATQAETNRLLPNSIRDVIEWFGEEADAAMQKRIAAERGFSHMRTRDKIAFAVRARLEFMTPHREAMRRLMIWYTLPLNMPLGV